MNLFDKKGRGVIGILSIGTFLEYFDLYLYFHFATYLNKLFFEQGDAKSNALMVSFAYCSSYLFRPIGAVIFGYLGDRYGRKIVINLTFFLMGISCTGIYFLPTYAEIGVAASFLMTFYRALQGMSSMGEVVGGEIYIVEYFKGKAAFVGIASLALAASVACQFALFGIKACMGGMCDFRNLFLAGLVIFALGYYARRALLESPEFTQAKITQHLEKTSYKTCIAAFFVESIQPVALFISVVGLNNIFREQFGYSEEDIVIRNLNAVNCHIFYSVAAIIFSLYANPIKMIFARNYLSVILMILMPTVLNHYMTLESVIIMQSLICILMMGDVHMPTIYLKNLPVLERFKVGALSFALSRAFIAVITSFGIILLKPYYGNAVYTVISIPFLVGYMISIRYFVKLDLENPNGVLKVYNDKSSISGNL